MFKKIFRKITGSRNYTFENETLIHIREKKEDEKRITDFNPTAISFGYGRILFHKGEKLKKLLEANFDLKFKEHHDIFTNPSFELKIKTQTKENGRKCYYCNRTDNNDYCKIIPYDKKVELFFNYDKNAAKFKSVIIYHN